jgi:GT2 family glycosyltransferase
MKTKIGVAILAYEGFSDLVRCVRSVKFNSKLPVHIIVFDNSEKTTMIRDYVTEAHPDVQYVSVGKNIGCSESRNLMLTHYLERVPNGEYLCIMDQDVECQKGWLKAMVNVAEANHDCGIVAWPMANRYRKVTNTGIVSEVASICNLHNVRSLLDVQEKWGGPWEASMFMHKFDSLICQRLNMLNWHTYLVLEMYKPHIIWPSQPAKILHHHPHAGVRRNAKWREIFGKSKRLYAQIQRREGWKEWVPPGPYLTYTGPVRGH